MAPAQTAVTLPIVSQVGTAIKFGRHIGKFAGIPATGKEVRVPLCVVYNLENDRITHGRVYFEMPALFQQFGM